MRSRGQQFMRTVTWLVTTAVLGGWTALSLLEAVEMAVVGERIMGEAALVVWPVRFLLSAGLLAALLIVVSRHPFQLNQR